MFVYQRAQTLTKINDATIKLNKINCQNEIHVAKITDLKNDILNLQISLKKFRQLVKDNANKKIITKIDEINIIFETTVTLQKFEIKKKTTRLWKNKFKNLKQKCEM